MAPFSQDFEPPPNSGQFTHRLVHGAIFFPQWIAGEGQHSEKTICYQNDFIEDMRRFRDEGPACPYVIVSKFAKVTFMEQCGPDNDAVNCAGARAASRRVPGSHQLARHLAQSQNRSPNYHWRTNMVTLRHAIKIAASRDVVYRALTDIQGMQGWHLGAITGKIAEGDTFYLERRPGLRFGWRTDRLLDGNKIVQTCIEGPGASDAKHLTIDLIDLPDGRTLVELHDEGWSEDNPHLPICNTYWGEALSHLRAYAEGNN